MTGVEFLYLLSTSTSVHYLMYTIYKQTTKVASPSDIKVYPNQYLWMIHNQEKDTLKIWGINAKIWGVNATFEE